MNLNTVKQKLPDAFDYKNQRFVQVSYSGSAYKGRSKEIIWQSNRGEQVYLYEDNIEHIKKPLMVHRGLMSSLR